MKRCTLSSRCKPIDPTLHHCLIKGDLWIRFEDREDQSPHSSSPDPIEFTTKRCDPLALCATDKSRDSRGGEPERCDLSPARLGALTLPNIELCRRKDSIITFDCDQSSEEGEFGDECCEFLIDTEMLRTLLQIPNTKTASLECARSLL